MSSKFLSVVKRGFRSRSKSTASSDRTPLSTGENCLESSRITSSEPLGPSESQSQHVEDDQTNGHQPYAECDRMWNEALEGTRKKKGVSVLPDDLLNNQTGEYRVLVEDIQRRLNDALGTGKPDGSVTRAVKQALEILRKSAPVFDVAVSVDPFHAALPWAAVRFALMCIDSKIDLEDVKMTGVALVLSLLGQADIYQRLYMAPDPKLRPAEEALKSLKASIVSLYSQSQVFLDFVIKCGEGIPEALQSPFKLTHAQKYVQNLRESEKGLYRTGMQCESLCNLTNRGGIQEILEIARDLQFVAQDISEIKLALEDMDIEILIKTLDWISPIEFNNHHTLVHDKRTEATCEWLLQHADFQEWDDPRSSSILWLQGQAGAGKTFLTSKVIDHISDSLEGSETERRQGFAFFYCNRIEEQRRDSTSILRSYVRQLSSPAGPEVQAVRKSLRKLCQESRLKALPLNTKACHEQLLESINLYDRTILVLDALDECEPDSRREVAEAIKALTSEAKKPLKIFISSRPYPEIRRYLNSWPILEITATDNNKDIESFIRGRMNKDAVWEIIHDNTKENVIIELCKRSQGMFQWANLQMQQLSKLKTDGDILDRLGRLPPDLQTTYDEIYNESGRGREEKLILDHACTWVMTAYLPPSASVLADLVKWSLIANEDDFAQVSSSRIDEALLLSVCNNFLVLDRKSDEWRFAHLSVAEYLEEKEYFRPEQAQCRAAKTCLRTLCVLHQEPLDIPDIPNILEAQTELYVSTYWLIHLRSYQEIVEKNGVEADASLIQLLKKFLGSPETSSVEYRGWYRYYIKKGKRIHINISNESDRYEYLDEIGPEERIIKTMCRIPLFFLLRDWWSSPETLLSLEKERDKLFMLAIRSGHLGLCQRLLACNVNLDFLGPRAGHPNTPLTAAICGKHWKIAALLVSKGVNIDLQTGEFRYGSALIAAADSGSLDILQLLVDGGADVNLRPETGCDGSALAAAAFNCNMDMVQFLINRGAVINLQLKAGSYGSALAAAAYRGEYDIVQLLLDRGADINLQLNHGDYGSALAAAAYVGELDIVKLLIDRGADINLQLNTGDYGSALAAAARYKGKLDIVQLLVDRGADVNLQVNSGSYGSALAAASWGGTLAMVQFFIDRGADINLQLKGGYYGSALAAAATQGTRLDTVQLLLDRGADINLQLKSGDYGSALAAAARYGFYTDMVQLLLDRGADINLQLKTGDFGSALTAAVYGDKLAMVQLLIDRGADINLQLEGRDYSSALAAAASYGGRLDIVQLLVNRGADVDF